MRYSTTSDRRNVHCSSVCEVLFHLSSAVNQYVVDVWVINSQGDLVRQLSTINSKLILMTFLLFFVRTDVFILHNDSKC